MWRVDEPNRQSFQPGNPGCSTNELDKLKAQLALVAQAADGGKSPGNGYHSGIESKADAVKWVQVDLGQSLLLDEVRLIPARPVDFPDTPGFGFPVRFRVEFQTNADFSTPNVIADHTAADFKNPGDNAVTIPANNNPARFVRVTATRLWERTGDYVFALAELEIVASGTNVALGTTVSALDSIEAGSWSKKFLVDGFDSRRKLNSLTFVAQASDQTKLETEVQSLAGQRRQLVETLTDQATRSELTAVSNAVECNQSRNRRAAASEESLCGRE